MKAKSSPHPKTSAPSAYSEQSLKLAFPHTSPENGRNRIPTKNQLGEPIATFARSKINPGDRFLLIVSGILWVSVLVYASYQYFYGSANFGQSAGVAWSRPGFLLAGGLCAAWLLGLALVWFNRKSTILYNQGIVMWNPGIPKKVLLWREIGGVSFAQDEWKILSKKIIHTRAILYPNQVKPIKLVKYCPKADLPELVTLLKAKLYPHLEPELRKSVLDGKRVYFGLVSLSLDGLYLNNYLMSWDQLDRIDIENGGLLIHFQDGTQRQTDIIRIPNLELLLPLIQLTSESVQRQGVAPERGPS